MPLLLLLAAVGYSSGCTWLAQLCTLRNHSAEKDTRDILRVVVCQQCHSKSDLHMLTLRSVIRSNKFCKELATLRTQADFLEKNFRGVGFGIRAVDSPRVREK